MEYNLSEVVYYEEVFSVRSFYYDRDVARSVQRKAAEADNKQIRLHLFDRVEDYNYLLRDFESMLPAGLFFRVQRSYLVNLQYIDSYDAKSVTLKNGETLPLKSKDFQKAYHNFMFLVNH